MKLIDSNYNTENGVSTATIGTEIGQFTGYAKVAEEDKDIISTFAGCRYAEMKAIAKYWKRKKVILRTQVEILQKTLSQMKLANYDEKSCDFIQKQIYLLEDNIYICKLNNKSILEKLKEEITTREKQVRKNMQKDND